MGKAAEGLQQPDQGLKAYRRAAENQPDQLLAWQVSLLFLLFYLL